MHESPVEEGARRSERTARILVVEDDGEMRLLLAAILRLDGHLVVAARNGAQGLDWLTLLCREREGPDLVITDLRMPGCSGLDVVRAARLLDGSLPVVLMTAFGDPTVHDAAYELGAVAVIDKPFDGDLVRRVAGRFLVGATSHESP